MHFDLFRLLARSRVPYTANLFSFSEKEDSLHEAILVVKIKGVHWLRFGYVEHAALASTRTKDTCTRYQMFRDKLGKSSVSFSLTTLPPATYHDHTSREAFFSFSSTRLCCDQALKHKQIYTSFHSIDSLCAHARLVTKAKEANAAWNPASEGEEDYSDWIEVSRPPTHHLHDRRHSHQHHCDDDDSVVCVLRYLHTLQTVFRSERQAYTKAV